MDFFNKTELDMMAERLEVGKFRKGNDKSVADRAMEDILADDNARIRNEKKFHRKNDPSAN